MEDQLSANWYGAAVVVLALVALNICCLGVKAKAHHEWHQFWAWRPRRLDNGTYAAGDLMRRKTHNGWVYRHETEDECIDRINCNAW